MLPTTPLPAVSDLQYLMTLALALPEPYRSLSVCVLDSDHFRSYPGSTGHHHSEEGGLLRHTAEVVRTCEFYHSQAPDNLDWPVLLTAALWHDYGKIWDYEAFRTTGNNPGEMVTAYQKTRHRDIINHPARSYAEFMSMSEAVMQDEERDEIGHLILSHHGRRDWGAIQEPKTAEAWALHLADMASAFCYGIRPNPAGK